MQKAESNGQLDVLGRRLMRARSLVQDDVFSRLVMVGRERRGELNNQEEF